MIPTRFVLRLKPGLLCLFVVFGLAGSSDAEPVRPIAIVAMADGDLMILHRHGALLRVDPREPRLVKLPAPFGPWQPLDMAVAVEQGHEYIYMTQYWPVRTERSLYRLARYDAATGKVTASWMAGLPFSTGVTVPADGEGSLVYVAAHLEGEIFKLDVSRSTTSPHRVVRFWEAERLGALAFDPTEQNLWVIDSGRGILLSVSIDGGRERRVPGDLAFPVALAVDAERRRLFVLDNVRRQVQVVDLDAEKLSMGLFAEIEGAEDPTGLAVDGSGVVWVGDARTGRLYAFNSDGKFLRRLRLEMP